MGYADQWKAAKKEFETNTGKKKPTEKFLGVFRKSTGLESAAKAMDDSCKSGQSISAKDKKARQALKDFQSATRNYTDTLEKAEEHGEYNAEIAKLKLVLTKIIHDFKHDVRAWIQPPGDH